MATVITQMAHIKGGWVEGRWGGMGGGGGWQPDAVKASTKTQTAILCVFSK